LTYTGLFGENVYCNENNILAEKMKTFKTSVSRSLFCYLAEPTHFKIDLRENKNKSFSEIFHFCYC
jgi:hypothetical protein